MGQFYIVLRVPYMIIHLRFFSFSGARTGPCIPCSCAFVFRSSRTRFMKRRSTLCAVFADVSRKSQPNDRASAAPSSLETSRSYCLSHLLPTSMKTGFCRLTFNMACRKTSSRSNVARDAIEYTRINPWPSLQDIWDRGTIECKTALT